MRPRWTRALPVTLLTCALVLSGCSKGAPEPVGGPASGATSATTTPSTSAPGTEAPGDEVAGRSGGFTVVPPEGWSEATDKADGVANIDLVLLSSKKVGSFANNLVVISTDGDEATLEAELAKGKEQMSTAGRTISDAPGKSVAGATAVGFTTTFEQQGIQVLARSYGVLREGRLYLLTLSSSQGDASHAMAELDELLSTWVWT